MRKTLSIIILLSGLCYAAQQEEIVDFKDDSVPVLNNELRKMGDSIDSNTSSISSNKGKVMTDSSDTAEYLEQKVKNSIEVDSNDLQLVGDEASPGNNKVYGTNGSGTKGWQTIDTFTGGTATAGGGTVTSPTIEQGTWGNLGRNMNVYLPSGTHTVYLKMTYQSSAYEYSQKVRFKINSSYSGESAPWKHSGDVTITLSISSPPTGLVTIEPEGYAIDHYETINTKGYIVYYD